MQKSLFKNQAGKQNNNKKIGWQRQGQNQKHYKTDILRIRQQYSLIHNTSDSIIRGKLVMKRQGNNHKPLAWQ